MKRLYTYNFGYFWLTLQKACANLPFHHEWEWLLPHNPGIEYRIKLLNFCLSDRWRITSQWNLNLHFSYYEGGRKNLYIYVKGVYVPFIVNCLFICFSHFPIRLLVYDTNCQILSSSLSFAFWLAYGRVLFCFGFCC